MNTIHNSVGGDYAYLRGGAAFSSAVVALPGFEIVRVRFARWLPLADGFDAIAAHLRQAKRPLTALCAAELRSPRPLSLDGFGEFNRPYLDVLREWGLLANETGTVPVARCNVCPSHDAPSVPSFHAFSYTVPVGAVHSGSLTTSGHASDAPAPRSFVLSGFADWPEGAAFPEGIIAHGDTSAHGLERKFAFVLDGVEHKTAELGVRMDSITGVQIYTVHDFGPLVGSLFATRGLTRIGLEWQVSRPPIDGLELEIDVRSVRRELVID